MIKDSGKRLFDMIIVWKLDRFARNRYDSARYKAQLKKNGVKVISATETISDGAEGILLESMLEGMAEYYSADLAEKVVRGMTENALKCKYNGGTRPIGYVIDSEQEKMAKNRKAPARHKAEDDYLLTTKLFCGYCGAYLCGESGTSRTGIVHHYYKCVSIKKKRAQCHKKPVKKDWIEELVVNETMKAVMDDSVIEAIVSMLMDLQEQESTSLPLYEKELKDTEAAIENMLNAIQQGIFNKSTKARLDELEATKDELETRIACEKLVKPKITAEQMTFWHTSLHIIKRIIQPIPDCLLRTTAL